MIMQLNASPDVRQGPPHHVQVDDTAQGYSQATPAAQTYAAPTLAPGDTGDQGVLEYFSGFSILMTLAPMSASNMVQHGPAMMCITSNTRIPSRAAGMNFLSFLLESLMVKPLHSSL
jgi:hypothetical protein